MSVGSQHTVIIVTPDIVGPIKNGGIGTACFHYARSLANAGFRVDILFTGPTEKADAEVWRGRYAARGIGFWTLNDLAPDSAVVYGPRWYTGRSWAVMQFLRKRDDDYILFQDWHGNGFWSMRAKRMGYAFANTTLGVIAHSPTEWQNAGMSMFGHDPLHDSDLAWTERCAIAEADLLVSPSRHMIEWLREHDFALPRRVVLSPYTFEDALQECLPPPDTDHLLFFGRLETRKGLHLLADALRRLPADRLPRRLSLLGKYATVQGMAADAYIDKLRSDLPTVAIAAHIDFDYAEAIGFLRNANGVVVMPSTLDNLPLTIIECITKGLHFIASDVGGIPEMVDPALLFKPTVGALAEKLEQREVIDFATATHLYSPEDARTAWLDHVADVVQKPRPAAPAIARPRSDGVSVCIPFFKHDRYLRRVISSFLQMRDRNMQLVFVNDGTPEEECPLFHEIGRRLEPLGHIFHTQSNTGPGGARNAAVSLARYDNILFFDSDNVAFPNLLTALQSAKVFSEADIVAAPFVAVPPMQRQPTMEDVVYTFRPSGGSLSAGMIDNMFGDVCSLWSRKVIEALGGFSTSRFYWEDWEMYLQAASRGFTQFVYPEPLFFYTYEEHERRAETLKYTNYKMLWRRLGELPPARLAEITRSYVQHYCVRQSI